MGGITNINWWQWLPLFPWRIVAAVSAADEIPLRLPRNGIVLVGTRERPKWFAFDCPCRTGHRIMINMDRANAPHWKVSGNSKLTLWPSIDYRTSARRCHYFIRNGRIDWVHDRERMR